MRKANRDHLASDTQDGGITLVLGAGTSFEQGVPGWDVVAKRAWAASREDPYPAIAGQWLPFIFELARGESDEAAFEDTLRNALYEQLRPDGLELERTTLGSLARLIYRESKRGAGNRICRVVVFNADDLLDQAVSQLWEADAEPDRAACSPVRVVSRSSHHPRHQLDRASVPVYHIHGYLPQKRDRAWHENAPDALVFTDAQYWDTVGSPMSFPNRVMMQSLHDSHCVFVGTSMTDSNVLRWLGVRHNELVADKSSQFLRHPTDDEADRGARTRSAVESALQRHYWVRTPGGADADFISTCLDRRGVRTIELASWSDLPALFDEAFPG